MLNESAASVASACPTAQLCMSALSFARAALCHVGDLQSTGHDFVIGVVQLGFFNIVGIPLFKAMADLFEDSQPMLDGVLGNFRLWEAMAAEATAT